MDWFEHEKQLIKSGYSIICGLDEAGRGPLAGPVFAAAVILKSGEVIEGLNDSKKISAKKREQLYEVVTERAVDYSIASASVQEIDSINILRATFLAMKRALQGLKVDPDFVLVDGNMLPLGINIPSRAIVKGDSLCASIAAASILAKVSRDRLMCKLDEKYPQYGFAKHKGYGTKLHIEMIHKYGTCPYHRRSFLKNISGVAYA